ncbi:hypothetical protein A2899_02205 [Candidatus Amesbacteria bacterium RIFCSPLOWO2_01_FULL_49_25]|uniref:Glycosyltransferase RgtA/B/C/D-like domain-containing protein n=1 Tax=Candidatus Amesbacteria bacterium RIFCSPHIGHO2_01_FULL_48_32b TaxID=1797253 RepID=A0A1F4YE71_9BACT|nr:MAG: hypothetical protein A2876_02760 [Candidatus Amesbacteria bacterium RIFCSPHIGHO2_01_FULL_48_32b]OGD08138.1 MAG: hypothetical protein A2899_02205 [Candidatus Amesbacteria bacterium RIFCSPLOWO2_01_FULL_49_25]
MKHKIILAAILGLALFLRVYRTQDFLGFWYDQGRDAKVIWDFIHNGKFFLVGPVTGISGIFRGPWYYWLITPAYWLGNGNPVWPAVFLSSTTVLAAFLVCHLTTKIAGSRAGLLAVFITAISYPLMHASRWLSNPTPMFLINMLLVYFLFKVIDGKKWAWIGVGFLFGQSMQFGSATEIFILPAIIIFLAFNRSLFPGFKIFLLSLSAIFLSFAPQILFDIRHQGIISQNLLKFFVADKSFQLSFLDTLIVRLPFYLQTFGSKLFPSSLLPAYIFLPLCGLSLFRKFSNHFQLLLVLFFTPLVGMLFFHGNEGNVYDYYFTGFYLVFVIIFSVLAIRLNRLVLVSFLAVFLYQNISQTFALLSRPFPGYISLSPILQAVDWVYTDAKDRAFNTDAYVPPIIPHAYDYVFLWRGTTWYRRFPDTGLVTRLYTIVEPDDEHPQLRYTWLVRQSFFSSVEEEHQIGPLLVQRRFRHKFE